MKPNFFFIALPLLLILGGCGEETRHYSIPKSPSKPAGEPPAHGGHVHRPYDFTLPEGWSEQAASGMRMASFRASSGALDGSIVILGAAAGNIPDNINRWRKQAGLPELQATEIDSTLLKDKNSLGHFVWCKLISPDEGGTSILASIHHLGPERVLFVKLSGPGDKIEKEGESFLSLCKSLRPHTH